MKAEIAVICLAMNWLKDRVQSLLARQWSRWTTLPKLGLLSKREVLENLWWERYPWIFQETTKIWAVSLTGVHGALNWGLDLLKFSYLSTKWSGGDKKSSVTPAQVCEEQSICRDKGESGRAERRYSIWRICSKTNQDTAQYFANVFPALNKTFSAKRNISRR